MQNSIFSHNRWRISLLTLGIILTAVAFLRLYVPTDAQAGVNCSAPYEIDETFTNGARWQLCWEQRNLDGIVLRSIYFTPPGGTPQKVLAQGSISQVHVPYDDNSARFHDITDDGFGNENLNNLTPAECPDGTLLKDGAKNALCKQRKGRGPAFAGLGTQEQGELLSLFSVSTSGEYNYIPVWRFFDDGSIELMMGATGKLQRFTTNAQFGWPVRANGTRGTSHIHNYYWRLDFDLGEAGEDDVVEELNYTVVDPPGAAAGTDSPVGRQQRTLGVSRFAGENGRSIAPTTLRSWRIRDGSANPTTGRPISYHLQPMTVGHRDVGPANEPWTANDFYVTKYRACERYVSHNPQVDGCGNHLGSFVNGESLENADVVLWYGVTFHHIPRDEDEVYMHAHWDGFRLVPRDLMAANPAAVDLESCAVGDVNCDAEQNATDALFMLQHAVQLRTFGEQIPPAVGQLYGYACDVSGDGGCDAVDALLALQCTVNIDNRFCPGAGGLQAAQALPSVSSPATLTIGDAIDAIDATGTIDTTNDTSDDAVNADAADAAGERQQIPLRLTVAPTAGALMLTLAYDPTVLTAVTCEAGGAAEAAAQAIPAVAAWDSTLCQVDEASGLVHFAAIAAKGVSGMAANHDATDPYATVNVGTLSFQSNAATADESTFSVQKVQLFNSNAMSLPVKTQIQSQTERLYLPSIMR